MSRSLNKCEFIGNLTRDPEIRYLSSGTAIVDVGIAVNESYKKDDDWVENTIFLNLTGWDRLAEKVAAQYKKGDGIYVVTKLKIDTWEDKTTGEKRSAPKFTIQNHWPIAKDVKFDGGTPTSQVGSDDEDDDVETDDIPF